MNLSAIKEPLNYTVYTVSRKLLYGLIHVPFYELTHGPIIGHGTIVQRDECPPCHEIEGTIVRPATRSKERLSALPQYRRDECPPCHVIEGTNVRPVIF